MGERELPSRAGKDSWGGKAGHAHSRASSLVSPMIAEVRHCDTEGPMGPLCQSTHFLPTTAPALELGWTG